MVKKYRHVCKFLLSLTWVILNPAGAISWENIEGWNQRQLHPESYFLLYGNRILPSFAIHNSFDAFQISNWPLSFSNPAFSKWLNTQPQNLNFQFIAHLGNEVGDPHLMELRQKGGSNHTPINEFFLFAPLSNHLSVGLAFDQNDMGSSRFSGTRSGILKGDKSSWFGENLPEKSLASGWFLVKDKDKSGRLYFESGWLWMLSPKSGVMYPINIQNAISGIRYKNFEMGLNFLTGNFLGNGHGDIQKLEWIPAYKQKWNFKKVSFDAEIKGGFSQLNIQAGQKMGNNDSIELNTGPAQKFRFELGNSFKRHISDSSAYIQIEDKIAIEEGQISGNGILTFKQNSNIGATVQKYTAFINHNQRQYSQIKENWNFNTKAPPDETFYYYGNEIMLGYQSNNPGPIRFKLNTFWKAIWNTPVWRVDSLWQINTYTYRSAQLKASGKVFSGLSQEIILAYVSKAMQSNLGVKLNYNNARDYLLDEHIVSNYVYFMESCLHLKTNLRVTWSSYYLGPKYVLGWSEREFRIKPHFEHNISLSQSFLRERLLFKYSAFHLFGKEVLEHPNGNPYRFRIITGLEARF